MTYLRRDGNQLSAQACWRSEAKEKEAVGPWEACDNPQRQIVPRGKAAPCEPCQENVVQRAPESKNNQAFRGDEKFKFPGSVAP